MCRIHHCVLRLDVSSSWCLVSWKKDVGVVNKKAIITGFDTFDARVCDDYTGISYNYLFAQSQVNRGFEKGQKGEPAVYEPVRTK